MANAVNDGGNMKIGTLVRGKINELIGFVTDVTPNGDGVKIYWYGMDLRSTTWVHTCDLEVLCE